MSSNRVTLSIWAFSDGVSTNIPPATRCLVADDTYLEHRIGKKLAEERGNGHTKGQHKVDRLPRGYTCWKRGRTVHAHLHTDRYIYGHPSGGYFDSFNKAWQHFKQLESTSSNVSCACVLCKRGGFAKSSASTKTPSLVVKLANRLPALKSSAASQPPTATAPIINMGESQKPNTSRLRNPYDILGLYHTATADEINSAWRTILSMLPDVLNDEEREEQRRLNNARHILCHDKMRKFVDQCIARKEKGLHQAQPWAFLKLKENASKEQILSAYEDFRKLWAEFETSSLVVFDVVRDARDLLLSRLK